jgi:hypothetical protein
MKSSMVSLNEVTAQWAGSMASSFTHLGEIVAAKVTTGNVHDTQPVRELARGLIDKLYGNKGYLVKP